jgi:hypothetical protein
MRNDPGHVFCLHFLAVLVTAAGTALAVATLLIATAWAALTVTPLPVTAALRLAAAGLLMLLATLLATLLPALLVAATLAALTLATAAITTALGRAIAAGLLALLTALLASLLTSLLTTALLLATLLSALLVTLRFLMVTALLFTGIIVRVSHTSFLLRKKQSRGRDQGYRMLSSSAFSPHDKTASRLNQYVLTV